MGKAEPTADQLREEMRTVRAALATANWWPGPEREFLRSDRDLLADALEDPRHRTRSRDAHPIGSVRKALVGRAAG